MERRVDFGNGRGDSYHASLVDNQALSSLRIFPGVVRDVSSFVFETSSKWYFEMSHVRPASTLHRLAVGLPITDRSNYADEFDS